MLSTSRIFPLFFRSLFAIISLCFTFSKDLKAQTNTTDWHYYFKDSLTRQLDESRVISLRDNNLLTFITLGAGKFGMIKSDTTGKIIWERSYFFPGFDTITFENFRSYSIIEHPSGQIAVVIRGTTTAGMPNFYFLTFDKNGKNTRIREFPRLASLEPQLEIEKRTSNYVLFGNFETSNFSVSSMYITITKIDTNGNILLTKRIVKPFQAPYQEFIRVVPANFGWILSFIGSKVSQNTSYPVNPTIIKLSENFIVEKSILLEKQPHLLFKTQLIKIDDNDFYLYSNYYDTLTTPGVSGIINQRAFIQRFDSNLSLKWTKRMVGINGQLNPGLYSGFSFTGSSEGKLFLQTLNLSQIWVNKEGEITSQINNGTVLEGSRFTSFNSLIKVGKHDYINSSNPLVYYGLKTVNLFSLSYARISSSQARKPCDGKIYNDSVWFMPDTVLFTNVPGILSETIQNYPVKSIPILSDSSFKICRYDNYCIKLGGFGREFSACTFPFQATNFYPKISYYDERYLWSTGDTSSSPIFETPKRYELTRTFGCFTLIDTVRVLKDSIFVLLPNNSISGCAQSTITVQGNYGGIGTKYYSNFNNQVFTDVSDATFLMPETDTVINRKVFFEYKNDRGCSGIDSQLVEINPVYKDLLPDSILICPEEDTLLNFTRFYPKLALKFGLWKSPAGVLSSNVVQAKADGTYRLEVFNICPVLDSVFVGPLPPGNMEVEIKINDSAYFAIPDPIWFKDTVSLALQAVFEPDNARWLNAERNLILTENGLLTFLIRQDTSFSVILTRINGGCGEEKIFRFNIKKSPIIPEPPGEPQFPNLVTPNGDGKNEKWTSEKYMPQNGSLKVYNRWGKLVYERSPYKSTWPDSGTLDGNYFYIFEYPANSKMEVIKNWVLIQR